MLLKLSITVLFIFTIYKVNELIVYASCLGKNAFDVRGVADLMLHMNQLNIGRSVFF